MSPQGGLPRPAWKWAEHTSEVRWTVVSPLLADLGFESRHMGSKSVQNVSPRKKVSGASRSSWWFSASFLSLCVLVGLTAGNISLFFLWGPDVRQERSGCRGPQE